jgi:protein ImuA
MIEHAHLPGSVAPDPVALLPGLMRGMGATSRTPHWQPGLAPDCRHTELFASTRDASGAGLALAFARDVLRQEQAAETPDRRPFLWVQDKAALRLSGRPYLPGLPAELRHRLIHVAATTPEDALFALEEGLRCRDLAFVIGELGGNPRALDFTASRRLSLAAEKHGVPLWLVRLDARRDLGAARMRWEVGAAPTPKSRWNPHAPGPSTWRADLFRAHTFHPGQWTLRDDSALLVAEPASSPASAPDHGDLVYGHGDRSLAAG